MDDHPTRTKQSPPLDFPTAWALQREVGKDLDHHPRCSSVPGWDSINGPAFLCDCGALEREWARRKAAKMAYPEDSPTTRVKVPRHLIEFFLAEGLIEEVTEPVHLVGTKYTINTFTYQLTEEGMEVLLEWVEQQKAVGHREKH